jgi:hypothetical protein
MFDRRGSVRVECALLSSFRDLNSGQPGRFENATIRNISQSGIKMLVDQPIPTKDVIDVYIPLPGYHRTLEVQVIPLWVAKLPRQGQCEVGARFVGIKQEDEQAIQNFQYSTLLEKIPFRRHYSNDFLQDNRDREKPAA